MKPVFYIYELETEGSFVRMRGSYDPRTEAIQRTILLEGDIEGMENDPEGIDLLIAWINVQTSMNVKYLGKPQIYKTRKRYLKTPSYKRFKYLKP